MKLPLKLGPARFDRKNGGEFYVVKDAEGAWIGDIRAEHAPVIVVAMNQSSDASEIRTFDSSPPMVVRAALKVLLRHVEPGWENCRDAVQAWLDGKLLDHDAGEKRDSRL